jgi:hypothetical protein
MEHFRDCGLSEIGNLFHNRKCGANNRNEYPEGVDKEEFLSDMTAYARLFTGDYLKEKLALPDEELLAYMDNEVIPIMRKYSIGSNEATCILGDTPKEEKDEYEHNIALFHKEIIAGTSNFKVGRPLNHDGSPRNCGFCGECQEMNGSPTAHAQKDCPYCKWEIRDDKICWLPDSGYDEYVAYMKREEENDRITKVVKRGDYENKTLARLYAYGGIYTGG